MNAAHAAQHPLTSTNRTLAESNRRKDLAPAANP